MGTQGFVNVCVAACDQKRRCLAGVQGYVFGNRVAESGLDRAYQGKREADHRTSE